MEGLRGGLTIHGQCLEAQILHKPVTFFDLKKREINMIYPIDICFRVKRRERERKQKTYKVVDDTIPLHLRFRRCSGYLINYE